MVEGSISFEDNMLSLFGGLCLFFCFLAIAGPISLAKGTPRTLWLLRLVVRGQKVMGEVVKVHTSRITSNGWLLCSHTMGNWLIVRMNVFMLH